MTFHHDGPSCPVECLFDEAQELLAYAKMRHQRQPSIHIEYDCVGGVHTFAIRVDGEPVAAAHAASLERAAKLTREMLEAWEADSPEGLAHALEVSLETARAR